MSVVLWKRSTFFAPLSSASSSVPNPPAFSELVRAEIVFDTAKLRAIMVTVYVFQATITL